MQLSASVLFPVFIGAAHAATEAAGVFVVSGLEQESSGDVPALSSTEARLVFAQRLGVSQYHNIHEASDNALSYVNKFGIQSQPLFADYTASSPNQLIVVAEGWTSSLQKDFEKSFGQVKPQFEISKPASAAANIKLVKDLSFQVSGRAETSQCSFEDDFNPYSDCWGAPNRMIHVDMGDSSTASAFTKLESTIRKYTSSEVLDFVLVAMPESSRNSKSTSKPYGDYDMPAGQHQRRHAAEDPLVEFSTPKHQSGNAGAAEITTSLAANNKTLKGIIPFCHTSKDACITATNNCSGHGSCYKKFGNDDGSCFTCGCIADFHKGKNGAQTIYWGGAACQKRDISAQFWLIAAFSVTLVGLVSWGIGMMFSIGEEKLPGVIGAGVAPPKTGGR